MTYKAGCLVHHQTFGLGKVLKVEGDKVTVFFRNTPGNPKTIKTSQYPLEISACQSDPWLDRIDPQVLRSGKAPKFQTHDEAVSRFLRFFPAGFSDPEYLKRERNYKWDAHTRWVATLGRDEFCRLLQQKAYDEIVSRALAVESSTNLLSPFEKMPLHETLKSSTKAAEAFTFGLYELIYGQGSFEVRFAGFERVLSDLPQPRRSLLKWPIMTFFPFLALPKEHVFLKPESAKDAAQRCAFALNYRPEINWLTYSCFLELGRLLFQDLAELNPRDQIDVQSFIYVSGAPEGSFYNP